MPKCIIKNQTILDALIKIAEFAGNKVCETYKKEGVNPWIYFNYDPEKKRVVGSRTGPVEVVSLEEMIILISKQVERIELNGAYEAVLDRDKEVVQVGCQEIPFEKVTELYKLINKKK